MKKITMRVVFVLFILFSVFGLVGKTAIAQDGGVAGRDGWENQELNAQLQVGPPSLSIRPITDPDDIPLIQAQIQAYLMALQTYFQQLFSNIFDDNFPF